MKDKNSIKYMEEMALNAWPSHMSELYDGWIIRYSHNYTYRTNSVEQLGKSTLPLDEKIAFCEDAYRAHGTPASFKINPLTDPDFEKMLEDRGYELKHKTDTMVGALSEMNPLDAIYEEHEFENRLCGMPSAMRFEGSEDEVNVLMQPVITDEWIAGFFHLNGTSEPLLRRIVPAMFKAIPKNTVVCSVECDGHMVASGLGIFDREYIGIYGIYVSPSCRKRGYARAICSALIHEGRRQGATKAYLQVVHDNERAHKLYGSLGLEHYYTYWFRSKNL